MSMSDKPVMLIAGGTGSIGSETARQALEAGWRVVLHGRSDVRLAAVLEGMQCSRSSIEGFAADAFAAGGTEEIIGRAGKCFGRIDAVVDCVSSGAPGITGAFTTTDPAAYAILLDRSAGHLQRLAHAALPWLARGGGTLIAFASDAGRFAAPRQSVLGASRAAIMAFVRNLAVEVARDGVRVHCISPSYVEGSASLVRTEARVGERVAKARARAGLGLPAAADIAPLVLFLCGDGARKITGQVISVNGGLNA